MSTPSHFRGHVVLAALAGSLALAVPAGAAPLAPAPLEVVSPIAQAQYGYGGYGDGRRFGYGAPRHRHWDGYRGRRDWGGRHEGWGGRPRRGYGYGYGHGGW